MPVYFDEPGPPTPRAPRRKKLSAAERAGKRKAGRRARSARKRNR